MKKVSVGCLLALLVVIVTGIIVYEIIRFCQRHFPPPPPPNPTNVVSAYFPLGASRLASLTTSAPQEDAGATFDWPCETTVEVSFWLDGTNLVMRAALPGTVDLATFRESIPTTNSSAITYEAGVVTVANSDPRYVVLENSPDAFNWQPVFTNIFGADQTNRISMTGPCSNLFFRAVLYNLP